MCAKLFVGRSSANTADNAVQELPRKMGLRGLLHSVAPHMVPLRPETEGEFVQLLEERVASGKPVSIEIRGGSVARQGTGTASVGTIGTFQYSVVCFATIDGREAIQFERFMFERFGSERGLGDMSERNAAAITIFLAADEQMRRLGERLPKAEISLITPFGPMDDGIRQQLHLNAKEAGVDVLSVVQLFTS